MDLNKTVLSFHLTTEKPISETSLSLECRKMNKVKQFSNISSYMYLFNDAISISDSVDSID
jgi:hypothetical protein